jgi:hypothetical protein
MSKLFIDDERDPVTDDWVVVRTSEDAINFIWNNGIPNEIAFDHDLGGTDTSILVINWMTDGLVEGRLKFPADFKYSVHSQNPVGVENIRSKMDQLLRHFK